MHGGGRLGRLRGRARAESLAIAPGSIGGFAGGWRSRLRRCVPGAISRRGRCWFPAGLACSSDVPFPAAAPIKKGRRRCARTRPARARTEHTQAAPQSRYMRGKGAPPYARLCAELPSGFVRDAKKTMPHCLTIRRGNIQLLQCPSYMDSNAVSRRSLPRSSTCGRSRMRLQPTATSPLPGAGRPARRQQSGSCCGLSRRCSANLWWRRLRAATG